MTAGDQAMNHDELFEHAAWVRHLALELVGDHNVAEDLVQETWLAFLVRRPTTERPVRPWLARVVRNQAALRRRKRAGERAREEEVARAEQIDDASKLVERAETSRKLIGHVLALDDPYRTTVLLRYYEGLTPKQIAARRGLKAATVRSHLHRGLELLRGRLNSEHGGDDRAWALALLPLAETARRASAPTLALAPVAIGVSIAATLFVGTLLWSAHEGSQAERIAVELADTRQGATSNDARTIRRDVAAASENVAAWREVTLIAQRDAQPLAGFVVSVDGDRYVSDRAGRIELPSAAKTCTAVNHEGVGLDVLTRHGAGRERQSLADEFARHTLDAERLELRSGPCFELSLRGAQANVHDLEARLVASGIATFRGDERPRQVAALRKPDFGFARPWVRFFDAPAGSDVASATWTLEVRDRDGFVYGAAPISDVLSTRPQLVQVELRATAVLECWRTGAGQGPMPLLLARADHGHCARGRLRLGRLQQLPAQRDLATLTLPERADHVGAGERPHHGLEHPSPHGQRPHPAESTPPEKVRGEPRVR